MTEAEITASITDILREIFQMPYLCITPGSNAQTVSGWDSMKQVMILMAIEEKFGISLSTREMSRLKNVGDLIAVVLNRTVPASE